jgi:hypothetical protein
MFRNLFSNTYALKMRTFVHRSSKSNAMCKWFLKLKLLYRWADNLNCSRVLKNKLSVAVSLKIGWVVLTFVAAGPDASHESGGTGGQGRPHTVKRGRGQEQLQRVPKHHFPAIWGDQEGQIAQYMSKARLIASQCLRQDLLQVKRRVRLGEHRWAMENGRLDKAVPSISLTLEVR